MSNDFVLFCKSYRNDVLRCKRLIDSISVYNKEKIPFFLSIPKIDIPIFEKYISFVDVKKNFSFELLTDEEIAVSSDPNGLNYYNEFSGYLHQQVIKSEAWKLIDCENYLCLDSDSYFTTEFNLNNFFHKDGFPYSLVHESDDLLNAAKECGKQEVIDNFIKDCNLMKSEFGRNGPNYDFGPPPMIWNRKVWQSLYTLHLQPKNENLWDAIKRIPAEIRWYGEALLKFKAIPIYPTKPLFNFFHYEWQYEYLINKFQVNTHIGEVMQSNWEDSLTPIFAKKNIVSRYWKKFKKILIK